MSNNIEKLVGFTFLLRGVDEERRRILLENMTIEAGQLRMEDPMEPNMEPTPVAVTRDAGGTISLVGEDTGVVHFSI